MDRESRTQRGIGTSDQQFLIDEVFLPGASVSRRELFAGRLVLVAQLRKWVAESSRHVVVSGERGVGKTSLVRAACSPPVPGNAIRVEAVEADTLDSLWARVAAAAPGPAQLEPAWTADTIAHWSRAISADGRVVIVLDAFDALREPATRAQVAGAMAAVAEAAPAVTVIVTGAAGTAGELVDAVQARAEDLHVPRLTPAEGAELAQRALEALGLTAESAVVERMATLSNGLPGAMQALGRAAARSAAAEGAGHISNAHLASAVSFVLEEAGEPTRQTYEQATVRARRGIYPEILLACALSPRDAQGTFSVGDVRGTLQRIVRREVRGLTNQVAALTEDGRGAILSKRGAASAARYRFVQPSLEPYILMRGLENGWATSRTPVWLPASPEALEIYAA